MHIMTTNDCLTSAAPSAGIPVLPILEVLWQHQPAAPLPPVSGAHPPLFILITQTSEVHGHRSHLQALAADQLDGQLQPLDTPRLRQLILQLQLQLSECAQDGPPCEGLGPWPCPRQPKPPLQWLHVSQGHTTYILNVQDVHYFEADAKYTRVVSQDGSGHIRLSLKELMDALDPAVFVQTHRSTVVNLRFVRAVHRRGELMEVELRGSSERLRVSEAHQAEFKAM